MVGQDFYWVLKDTAVHWADIMQPAFFYPSNHRRQRPFSAKHPKRTKTPHHLFEENCLTTGWRLFVTSDTLPCVAGTTKWIQRARRSFARSSSSATLLHFLWPPQSPYTSSRTSSLRRSGNGTADCVASWMNHAGRRLLRQTGHSKSMMASKTEAPAALEGGCVVSSRRCIVESPASEAMEAYPATASNARRHISYSMNRHLYPRRASLRQPMPRHSHMMDRVGKSRTMPVRSPESMVEERFLGGRWDD